MNITKNKKTGFGFIATAVACIFFLNGNINLIDPLPDIIGYFILVACLTKLSFLNEDVEDSQRFFRYMIISEIAKLAAIFWMFGLSKADERNTGMLLLGFVFSLVDTIILYMAYTKLFSGLVTLAYNSESSYVLSSKKINGKSNTDKIKNFTVFFIVFKAVLSILPEFSNLSTYDSYEGSSVGHLYEFIGLMRGTSVFFITVVGVIWLIKLCRYLFKVQKDEKFKAVLSEKYEREVLPKKGIFVKRSFKLTAFLLIFSSILLIDFRVTGLTVLPSELGYFSPDMFNIIPDLLSAVFLAAALLCSKKYITSGRMAMAAGCVFYFLSVSAAYILEIFFYSNYTLGAVYRDADAYNTYIAMIVTAIVAAIGFLISVLVLIKFLKNMIDEHTGFAYGLDAEKDKSRVDAQHKELYRKFIYIALGAVAVAGTKLFYVFGAKDFNFAGAIQVIGALIYCACVAKVCHDISDEIETKYMLD